MSRVKKNTRQVGGSYAEDISKEFVLYIQSSITTETSKDDIYRFAYNILNQIDEIGLEVILGYSSLEDIPGISMCPTLKKLILDEDLSEDAKTTILSEAVKNAINFYTRHIRTESKKNKKNSQKAGYQSITKVRPLTQKQKQLLAKYYNIYV